MGWTRVVRNGIGRNLHSRHVADSVLTVFVVVESSGSWVDLGDGWGGARTPPRGRPPSLLRRNFTA